MVPVASVQLFDSHGKLAGGESAGTGHKLRSAELREPVPGRYVFEATVDGQRVKRAVALKLGHTYHVKLIQSIS